MSTLSVAVVTFRTPAAMLARALDSLARAAGVARAAGSLTQLRVFVIDNSPGEAHGAVRDYIQDRLGDVRGDAGAIEVQQLPRLGLVGDDGGLQLLPRRFVRRPRAGGGERLLEAFVGKPR